jgi:hypothetical protein
MRFTLQVLLISILAAVAEIFLPWWSVAIVSFIVSLRAGRTPGRSFLMGFLGIFIFWTVAALITDIANEHILSGRVARVFHPLLNGYIFIIICAVVGGIVGGVAAWSAALFRVPKKEILEKA